jgi:hypothetical protein
MAIGSFIPVVGTAVGGMVGGAVGTVAGGYLSAIAYDKYVKDLVGGGVEAGIAAIFDTSNLTQAMMARDAFLREQGANDLKKAWDSLRLVSRDFNPAGIELVGPGATPYIVAPKPPPTPSDAAPAPEQQAALPPGTATALPASFQIVVDGSPVSDCAIADGRMRCERNVAMGAATWHGVFEGAIDGGTVTGVDSTDYEIRFPAVGCGYRQFWSYRMRYDFDDNGTVRVAATDGAIKLVSNTCPQPPKSILPPSYSGVANWRAR